MKKAKVIIACFGLAVFATTLSGKAMAQYDREFSVNLFQAAHGSGSFLTVEGAAVPEGFSFFVGGLVHYQNKPLVIRTCTDPQGDECNEWGGEKTALIEHHLSLDVAGGISLFRVFELGIVIPAVLYQTGEGITSGPDRMDEIGGSSGMDDIRLHLKFDLLHGIFRQKTKKFGLAIIPVLTIPVGKHIYDDSFMGDSQVTVHPKLAFTADAGRVRIGINFGYLWREEKDFYLATLGQRLTYGAALDIRIWSGLHGIIEVFGQNGFSSELTESPLEADLAVRYIFDSGLALTGGLGMGIIGAVGVPRVRSFLGLAYAPPEKKPQPVIPDTDGDGILDPDDQCPEDPEDPDGFEDEDGCPDLDNDKDGIPDKEDECPDDAEDKDEFEDEDGCPDPDNDKDGIPDKEDECPNEPEDKDDFEDENGCPDPDNDEDGIPDEKDECPNEPEDMDGVEDEDGCPDEDLAKIDEGQIKIMQKIYFEYNSSKIIGDMSFEVLEAVVKILKDRPDITIRVEGHTDNKGAKEYNKKLSARRANSVKKYLVEQGIDAGRLKTQGLGTAKPVADNSTEEGRAENRRVEFHITGQEGSAVKSEADGEKAKEKGKKKEKEAKGKGEKKAKEKAGDKGKKKDKKKGKKKTQ
ncbi:MAG: OmpA family protein [Pseudomonadota bacterium]